LFLDEKAIKLYV